MTNTVEREVIRNVDVPVFQDVPVPLDEVRPQPINLLEEIPQTEEVIENVEVEYVVHKERPLPYEVDISVDVRGRVEAFACS